MRFSDAEQDPGSDKEEIYANEDGFLFLIKYELAGNEGGILHRRIK